MDQFINWIINAFTGFFDWLGNGIGWLFNAIGDFFAWLGESINWILTGIWGFIAQVGGFISAAIDFIGLMIANILEVVEIAGMIIGIVLDFIRIVAAWIGQIIQLVFLTIQDFNTATPIVLPGLPRCVSAPLEHNACAVYYVVENTLLADDTIGTIIVPIVILMIDLWILFYVYRSVMGIGKLVQRFSE